MSRILVIDDRAGNRDFLVSLLAYRDHEVVSAGNGAEGLQRAHEFHPDLIICDLLMPVMDGFEFVRRLRAEPDLADIEVAFCTAYFHEHEAHRLAKQCGVRHVLSKPCEAEEVLALVERLLSGRQPVLTAPAADTLEPFLRQHAQLFGNRLVEAIEDLERASETLAAVAALNFELAGERVPGRLLDTLCRGARGLFKGRFALALIGGRGNFSPRLSSCDGVNPPLSEHDILRIDAHPGFGRAIRREASEQILRGDDERNPLPAELPPLATALRVPLCSPERNYGWLLIADPECAGDGSAELQVLNALAAHAARVHENHCLLLRAQQQADCLQQEIATRTAMQRRVELQYAVARVFAEADGFEQANRRLLERLAQLLDFDDALLWQVDAHHARLRRIEWCRNQAAQELTNGNGAHIDLSEPAHGIANRCWVQAQPIWSLPASGTGPSAEQQEARGGGTGVAFPIRLKQQVIGVIELRSKRPLPFAQELLDSLDAIGGQIAQFLERRVQHDQLLRLSRIHAVIAGINGAIVRLHDRAQLLAAACRIATEQGRFALSWIAEPADGSEQLRVVAAFGDDAGTNGDGIASVEPGRYPHRVAQDALRMHSAAWCNNLLADPRIHSGECRGALEAGMQAFIALPLSNGEQPLGLLCLYAHEPGVFNESEIALLSELADDIAFALSTIATRESLSFLEHHDPLTGLLNREGFVSRVGNLLADAGRDGQQLAIICFDIKRFRHINETFGREPGDRMLKELARRLAVHWPEPATAARISDDVFAAALVGRDAGSEILRQLQRWPGRELGGPFELAGYPLIASARAGIAIFPGDADSAEALLGRAESALRSAKLDGRQWLCFEPSMSARLKESLLTESRLRRALDEQQFLLHYQPKVTVEGRRVIGVEALLRWNDPEHGIVAPDAFVPILEESGLIVDVGAWAMQRALEDLRRLALSHPLRVAVNVSPAQLGRPGFADGIRRLQQEFPPDRCPLELEITESLIMEGVDAHVALLTELRSLQVCVSVDDFGTGYSSLAYLARLPVEALKIDRAFVADMCQSRESRVIVATTVSLAHSLGLRVIAEGVESEAQAQALQIMGCGEMQGFLIARPMSPEQLQQWLAAHAVGG